MAVASSVYFNVMSTLFIWIVSSAALSILPHFSSHYNEIIAAALFFPMMFATIAAQCIGRFLVRTVYYCRAASAVLTKAASNSRIETLHAFGNRSRCSPRDMPESPYTETSQLESAPVPQLVAFHRPFRRLVRSSALLSALICFLYAHCWSQTMSAFKVSRSDGAGAVCRAIFSPMAFGGMAKSLDLECGSQKNGASEASIWLIWAAAVLIIVGGFAQDEYAGKHSIKSQMVSSTTWEDSIDGDADDAEEWDGKAAQDSKEDRDDDFVTTESHDTPQGLEMVPWYSILLVYSLFDILVQLKVFLGRFDARTQQTKSEALMTRAMDLRTEEDCFVGIDCLRKRYPGCIFECEKMDREDLWIDFAADTGDGFNSSYHVSRMLAQPTLICRTGKNKKILPRGSHLVIGGDLAYPDPSPDSYEKRFFRTFEDALPPPPSFRRDAISLEKPALPVDGWGSCFATKGNTPSLENGREDLLGQYNGPCAFVVPGNHDWFDGLSTFSRYILSRDWLGGWLMPQQRSYFALKLSKGWWLLGFDLALSSDIDIDQFKFFANVAAKVMAESDSVIIVTHEPWWVIDSDFRTPMNELAEKNLRELMNTYLKGKVRLRIAGDLHHYTRHVPLRPRPLPQKLVRRRSKLRLAPVEPINVLEEKNEPELIVSGGGGAFLHGTHTFRRNIKVGEKQEPYTRVGCFPSEKVSRRLSWLNMWHFRWRNWRLDLVWATTYFGIISSLFPLCGIYEDYLQFNPNHNPLILIMWLSRSVLTLFFRILAAGRSSLVCVILLLLVLILLTDMKMKSSVRILWGLAHGLAHIAAALVCLLFVECATEWLIDEGIVMVNSGTLSKATRETTALASSLYQEYMDHFSYIFTNVTPILQGNSTEVLYETMSESFAAMSAFQRLHARAYAGLIRLSQWLTRMPLLQATLSVFDLPGMIAQRHTDMCSALCANGADCMMSHDPTKFILVNRATIVTYAAAIFLYFVILAIPAAGGVFGTWLALTLNIFKAQYNEGFSSLRIEHWKNFLKLHINKNGDLEIFAIGFRRVPKQWVKDPQWGGNAHARAPKRSFGRMDNSSSMPSWAWQRPSKWMPRKETRKVSPEIIDFSLIPKRPSAAAQYDINHEDIPESGGLGLVVENPIRARTSSF